MRGPCADQIDSTGAPDGADQGHVAAQHIPRNWGSSSSRQVASRLPHRVHRSSPSLLRGSGPSSGIEVHRPES